jgi:hypothetical protein
MHINEAGAVRSRWAASQREPEGAHRTAACDQWRALPAARRPRSALADSLTSVAALRTVALVHTLIAGAPTACAQKVSFAHPVNGGRIEGREVNFEIHTADFSMPEQGKVEVVVNGARAFELDKPRMTVTAPMECGFHFVQAFLVDATGVRTGVQSDAVHFLVDYQAAPPGATTRAFMPKEPGRVSVIIASHDRYDLLMESIESVKRQTYEDFEIIVVNDASVDERYYALIEDVMMIHLPYNIGRPGLVRNVGIAAASGEFVAFLDDDDVWLPHKLATQLSAMKAEGANISCSDAFAGLGFRYYGLGFRPTSSAPTPLLVILSTSRPHTCICICTCKCICACACVCICTCICICICACICICTCACTCICICACICICICRLCRHSCHIHTNTNKSPTRTHKHKAPLHGRPHTHACHICEQTLAVGGR